MPAGTQRKVGLSDLSHGDGRLHPGDDSLFLQEVLKRKAVHHGAEHAHVVRAGAFHAALLKLRAPEEVAAADHHGHLHTAADDFGDLAGDLCHHIGVQAHRAAAEHLAAKFE